ncbi:hypothetical protein EVAR_80313_1 [Eumeta japonica]|uniref:Uncharacterized protein n=1 Tax=Eumeta variegata TaxID=151549 RepID=A0A4C1UCN8_EUMVA|nr:hypothetical protein EVAR_80313_1 [Eumeta japonica]
MHGGTNIWRRVSNKVSLAFPRNKTLYLHIFEEKRSTLSHNFHNKVPPYALSFNTDRRRARLVRMRAGDERARLPPRIWEMTQSAAAAGSSRRVAGFGLRHQPL